LPFCCCVWTFFRATLLRNSRVLMYANTQGNFWLRTRMSERVSWLVIQGEKKSSVIGHDTFKSVRMTACLCRWSEIHAP
jgi:hypothetical protein